MPDTKTNISVQLTGTDGNIFNIIGKVRAALRQNGAPISSKNSPIISPAAVPTKRLSAA